MIGKQQRRVLADHKKHSESKTIQQQRSSNSNKNQLIAMKIVNSFLLIVLGLVVAAATARPLDTTDLAATATAPSFEAVAQVHRRLQFPEGADVPCAQDISDVITCTLSNCVDRVCDETDQTDPSESGDCESLQTDYCAALDSADSCCPECAWATGNYLQCSLRASLEAICPAISLSCDAAGSNDSGGTATQSGEETASSGTADAAIPCPEIVGAYVTCAFTNCANSCTESQTIDTVENIADCGEVADGVCTAYSDHKECCPECLDAFQEYLSCGFAESTVAISCPAVTCDGTLVLKATSGGSSTGPPGRSVALSFIALGFFIECLMGY